MTFVILTGGIDLSIGSIVSFVNMVCAYMMINLNTNIWLAILISLVLAIIIGFINDTNGYIYIYSNDCKRYCTCNCSWNRLLYINKK